MHKTAIMLCHRTEKYAGNANSINGRCSTQVLEDVVFAKMEKIWKRKNWNCCIKCKIILKGFFRQKKETKQRPCCDHLFTILRWIKINYNKNKNILASPCSVPSSHISNVGFSICIAVWHYACDCFSEMALQISSMKSMKLHSIPKGWYLLIEEFSIVLGSYETLFGNCIYTGSDSNKA